MIEIVLSQEALVHRRLPISDEVESGAEDDFWNPFRLRSWTALSWEHRTVEFVLFLLFSLFLFPFLLFLDRYAVEGLSVPAVA